MKTKKYTLLLVHFCLCKEATPITPISFIAPITSIIPINITSTRPSEANGYWRGGGGLATVET